MNTSHSLVLRSKGKGKQIKFCYKGLAFLICISSILGIPKGVFSATSANDLAGKGLCEAEKEFGAYGMRTKFDKDPEGPFAFAYVVTSRRPESCGNSEDTV